MDRAIFTLSWYFHYFLLFFKYANPVGVSGEKGQLVILIEVVVMLFVSNFQITLTFPHILHSECYIQQPLNIFVLNAFKWLDIIKFIITRRPFDLRQLCRTFYFIPRSAIVLSKLAHIRCGEWWNGCSAVHSRRRKNGLLLDKGGNIWI